MPSDLDRPRGNPISTEAAEPVVEEAHSTEGGYLCAVQPHGVVLILDPESLAVRWYSQNLERIIGSALTKSSGFYTPHPPVITHFLRLEFPHSSWIDIARQIEGHERMTVACTSIAPGTDVRLLATVHHGRDGLVVDLEPATAPVLHNLHRLLETLVASGSVSSLCQRVADTLQSSTGVDRVAILRTHDGGNHEVVAESCSSDQYSLTGNGTEWMDVASRFNGVRTRRSTVLFDRTAVAVPLTATEQAARRREPDLSTSALQVDANSTGTWTANGGVRAALVVTVHRESQPWGLIVCSHGSPLAVHPADRAFVETVAIVMGGQIQALECQRHLDEAIAARMQSERERNQTSRWVVEALDHLSEAVISFDMDGRVLSFNRRMQELSRTTRGQTLISGANVHELADDEERGLLNRWISDISSQDFSPIEITRHDDDGQPRHYVCIARPVGLDPITAIVLTVRDVTEERNLQQKERALENRLVQAQQMEGLAMLAGGVAHDFNNLLVGIRCNAELVVSDARGLSVDMREALHDVIAASEVASDLTRQLLAYAGRGRGSVRRLDLVALIRQLKPLARVASHRVEPFIACDEARVFITADPTQIRQIILNVLVNAMEAVHPTEGRITVRVRRTHVAELDRAALHFDAFKREESLAAIEIQDNGCGMDAETMARVLEPFFSTRFTGRGLGLAAVVGAVRVHNGGIAIASAPGEGTTMTIYLPALSATECSEHLAAVTGSRHVILLGPVEELGEMASALEASVGVQTWILQSIQDVVNSRDALGAALKAAVIQHDSDMGRDLRAAQFLRSQSPDLMIIQLGGEREPGSGAVSVVMEKWSPAAVVRIVQERLNLERRLT